MLANVTHRSAGTSGVDVLSNASDRQKLAEFVASIDSFKTSRNSRPLVLTDEQIKALPPPAKPPAAEPEPVAPVPARAYPPLEPR